MPCLCSVVDMHGPMQAALHRGTPVFKTHCLHCEVSGSGYCLVGEIPPPPGGGVYRWVGGWVSPKFQHFAAPPPPGVRVRFFWDLGCAGL